MEEVGLRLQQRRVALPKESKKVRVLTSRIRGVVGRCVSERPMDEGPREGHCLL